MLSVGRAVGRARSELFERIRDADQPTVERKLAAEEMELVEVVFEGTTALRPQRRAQYLLGYKRVAVAIAADPAADPQKGREAIHRGHVGARKFFFEVGVKTAAIRTGTYGHNRRCH